ncbi:Scr1 family TA system antitoxin-like transcriptional regulator [Streptomyces sp. NPDC001091]
MRSARLVQSFQCVVLSAALQSAEYIRHVFQSAPNPTSETVGRAVAACVGRQSVLYESGREFVVVLTEAVLRTWPLLGRVKGPGIQKKCFSKEVFVADSLTTRTASSTRRH